MVDEIKSATALAQEHASQLRSGLDPSSLEKVDGDNTAAEAGVYRSYNKIKDLFIDSRDSINTDATNIEGVANILQFVDYQAANNLGDN